MAHKIKFNGFGVLNELEGVGEVFCYSGESYKNLRYKGRFPGPYLPTSEIPSESLSPEDLLILKEDEIGED